jgi:hypothetical protein
MIDVLQGEVIALENEVTTLRRDLRKLNSKKSEKKSCTGR